LVTFLYPLKNKYIGTVNYCIYFSLLSADLATAALLISFGAVLGKTTPLQLVIMGLIETAVFTGNEHLGLNVFKVSELIGLSLCYHKSK
jgi:ammonium transporter Rh